MDMEENWFAEGKRNEQSESVGGSAAKRGEGGGKLD
jgi:hypothetical protein